MDFFQFNQFSNLLALTTYRTNGVSTIPYESLNMAIQVGDDKDNVLINRKKLYAQIGINENQIVYMYQTHSTNIVKVSKDDGGKGKEAFIDGVYNVDGIYTYDQDLALATLHADCVPVIFYEKSKQLIGVIHAGWQGTIKEATYLMLKKVIEEEKLDVNELYVFIGPNIQDQLLIDEDVEKAMQINNLPSSYIIHRDDKRYLNIEQINLDQLARLNITNIEVAKHNTFLEKESFFSFARDNKLTGRHITLVMRTK
jgi:hypothetical protein